MSTSIVARMLQLVELPALLYQPVVCTSMGVKVLYIEVKVMVLPFVTFQLERDH